MLIVIKCLYNKPPQNTTLLEAAFPKEEFGADPIKSDKTIPKKSEFDMYAYYFDSTDTDSHNQLYELNISPCYILRELHLASQAQGNSTYIRTILNVENKPYCALSIEYSDVLSKFYHYLKINTFGSKDSIIRMLHRITPFIENLSETESLDELMAIQKFINYRCSDILLRAANAPSPILQMSMFDTPSERSHAPVTRNEVNHLTNTFN